MLSTAAGPRPFQLWDPRPPHSPLVALRGVPARPAMTPEEGVPARPPGRVPATTATPLRSLPQRGCRGRSADRIGPTPHWRGVARGPHRCLAAFTTPVAHGGPTSLRGPTRTPRSRAPHERLHASSAPPRVVSYPRSLRRDVRRPFPPPTLRRAVHPPPVVPAASCFCWPSGVPPPLLYHAGTFAIPSSDRGPGGRPTTRCPCPRRLPRWPTRRCATPAT